MPNAPHDQNFVKSRLGVWCVDGVTTIPIKINPVTQTMLIDTTSVISYIPKAIAPDDENYSRCMLFVGSDGLTYPWNVNASGAVLIST